MFPNSPDRLSHLPVRGDPAAKWKWRSRKKDGWTFPAELSLSREMKFEGGATRTIIVRDVTERKRAEEALREDESRFRTLAGATFEGVAITENGLFTDVTSNFADQWR